MALDNVTSHFSTMLEPIASASFLSSLSIIHAQIIENYRQCLLLRTVVLQKPVVGCSSLASIRYLRYWFYLPKIIHYHNVSLVTVVSVFSGKV